MSPRTLDKAAIDHIIQKDKILRDYCKENNITSYEEKEMLIENRHSIQLARSKKQKTPLSGVVKVEHHLYKLVFDKYQS
ncbi:MAG: hypothetical protein FD145_1388 [Candidatus Saganbacteria bacterium]|uniref:Uncharacterized protein n=1 Tax=Candidatus Saganbacteria bacterium TaxID=2575572 RepID=A0A833L096_UNCSA|nr:MAG: hypothetical protein FD145_1388 [Candidatus Saganbacteria bacterium]